jgi:hypothetical protein
MYVLPQEEGKPVKIVVQTLLQMGWVKSPPYFCTAMETLWAVATEYIKMPTNFLESHKFEKYVVGAPKYDALPKMQQDMQGFLYMVKVYVDDFMSLVIPVSQDQLQHVTNTEMHGIHDIFPPDAIDCKDPISEKKLMKVEGRYATRV